MHKSVGAIIWNKGKILMVDRVNPPYGWACPAGHVEGAEVEEFALRREIREETGLEIRNPLIVWREKIAWNNCSRHKGHDWYVFEVNDYSGKIKISPEAKGMKWVSERDIKKLRLERVWKHFFYKLGLLPTRKKKIVFKKGRKKR